MPPTSPVSSSPKKAAVVPCHRQATFYLTVVSGAWSSLLTQMRRAAYKGPMTDVIVQPFLAGLSTGLFCCAFCFPFVAPILVAEERSLREGWCVLGAIIGGRLVGYALFGLGIGFLGERFESVLIERILLCALIALSTLLMLYGVGWLRPTASWCGALIRSPVRAPFVMGLLMGINLCPPFLMSVIYVFTLHSALKGIAYFLMFFLGTSLYFLPLGFLATLSRWEYLRKAARISAVLVGLIFCGYGLYVLFWGVNLRHRL